MMAFTLWMGALMVVSPSAGQASAVEDIAKDLRPVSGYVVMTLQEEFLIDLDASHGLRVGDLFSVVSPGEKIVHPVTKKVIGSLDAVKAILKVTRIKSGYSYAKRISGEGDVSRGEGVHRFSGMTAAIYAPTGQGQEPYARLVELLPELDWQGRFDIGLENEEKGRFDLRFIVTDRELRLVDSRGYQLRTYPVVAADDTAQPDAAVLQPPSVVVVPPDSTGLVPGHGNPPSSGMAFADYKNRGELPGRVLMAAFAREKMKLLLATVDGNLVRVFDVTEGLQPLGATRVREGIANPLAVAWWQPEIDGPLYLAVTATIVNERFYGNSNEVSIESAIYEWTGKNLQLVIAVAPYFLGSFDRDGDGQAETLLGQIFDLDQTYGKTYALKLANNKLQPGKPPFPLPAGFVLPGSTLGDMDGDGQPELVTVRNEILSIYSGGKKVYQSSEQMGGSLATLTYDVNPGAADTLFKTVALEVPPILRDIDGDGMFEMLAVASEKSSLKVPGLGPGVRQSWVAVINNHNGMFDKGRFSFSRENPLQGIWVEDGHLYLVESSTISTLSQAGKSNLLVFPVTQVTQ